MPCPYSVTCRHVLRLRRVALTPGDANPCPPTYGGSRLLCSHANALSNPRALCPKNKKARSDSHRTGPAFVCQPVGWFYCPLTAPLPLAQQQGISDETCQNPSAYSRPAEACQVLSKPSPAP